MKVIFDEQVYPDTRITVWDDLRWFGATIDGGLWSSPAEYIRERRTISKHPIAFYRAEGYSSAWGQAAQKAINTMIQRGILTKDGTLPTQQEQEQPKEQPQETQMVDISQAVKEGVKQAAADEASELLFSLATQVLGEKLEAVPPAMRELVKAGMAVAILQVVQALPQLPVPRKLVEQGAQLQIQTATMRLVAPHMEKLQAIAEKLASTVKE